MPNIASDYALFTHNFWAISNQMEQSYGQKTFLQIKSEKNVDFSYPILLLILLCKFWVWLSVVTTIGLQNILVVQFGHSNAKIIRIFTKIEFLLTHLNIYKRAQERGIHTDRIQWTTPSFLKIQKFCKNIFYSGDHLCQPYGSGFSIFRLKFEKKGCVQGCVPQ